MNTTDDVLKVLSPVMNNLFKDTFGKSVDDVAQTTFKYLDTEFKLSNISWGGNF